eukprot:560352-Amorphochlora_amoeboformis.AAC.1
MYITTRIYIRRRRPQNAIHARIVIPVPKHTHTHTCNSSIRGHHYLAAGHRTQVCLNHVGVGRSRERGLTLCARVCGGLVFSGEGWGMSHRDLSAIEGFERGVYI